MSCCCDVAVSSRFSLLSFVFLSSLVTLGSSRALPFYICFGALGVVLKPLTPRWLRDVVVMLLRVGVLASFFWVSSRFVLVCTPFSSWLSSYFPYLVCTSFLEMFRCLWGRF